MHTVVYTLALSGNMKPQEEYFNHALMAHFDAAWGGLKLFHDEQ